MQLSKLGLKLNKIKNTVLQSHDVATGYRIGKCRYKIFYHRKVQWITFVLEDMINLNHIKNIQKLAWASSSSSSSVSSSSSFFTTIYDTYIYTPEVYHLKGGLFFPLTGENHCRWYHFPFKYQMRACIRK